MEEVRATFNEYVEYNRRDLEELRKKQLKQFLIYAREEALKVAPTRAEIEAKVQSLGWRVIKRGTPEKWGANAAKGIFKRSMRGMTKAERAAEKASRAAAVAAIDQTTQMQNYVIKKRSARIGFMASAYAIAARMLGFNAGKVPSVHASAVVSESAAATSIAASAGGIADVAERTGFLSVAIDRTIANMRIYIEDRQMKGRQKLSRR